MRKEMRNKLLKYASIGFLLGAVVDILISLIETFAQGGKTLMEFSPVAKSVGIGGAIALQLTVSGALGAACMADCSFTTSKDGA